MNIYDEKDVKTHIKKDLAALGAAAPAYGGGENIRTLLAYLNRYCGEYLRWLQRKGVIVSFRFGISPVFFWQPQLRVVLKTGQKADFALSGMYKLRPLFLRGI
nr:MAG TPA: hypothetical protein [Caudoviricetes sp.]